jgi:hypothetical protein
MALNATDAYRTAAEIVKAALEGDGIKLRGAASATTTGVATTNANIDVAYLDALVKGLVKTLTT